VIDFKNMPANPFDDALFWTWRAQQPYCACGGTGIAPSIDPENEDGYEPCPDCEAGKALREKREHEAR
jgi:hypothetical protein